MSQEFSDALSDALDRLVQGQDIQECLRLHPRHADELEPLLRVAEATIRTAEQIRPDPAAKARNFQRFSDAVASGARSPRKERGRSWLSRLWTPLVRPVAVAAAALAIFATGIGATTAAASGSVPGEPLYWVKTTRENLEQTLHRSDMDRANYQAKLAQVRGDEMRKLIERRNFTRADSAMERMNRHLDRSARYAGVTITVNLVEVPSKPPALIGPANTAQLRTRLEQDRAIFKNKVRYILARLRPEERRRAEQYFRRTELGYWLLIDAMQNNQPIRIIVPVATPLLGR